MSNQTHAEVGISFLPDLNRQRLINRAELVGKADFDVITAYEDLGYPSPILQLICLAERSPHSRVGPACVVVPKYATMESVLSQVSILESVSPGNSFVGLAPGSWMSEIGLHPAPVSQMKEAIESYLYLQNKRVTGYFGEHFQISPGFQVQYPTSQNNQVMVGAWGPKMIEMARTIPEVTEIKAGGSANPQVVRLLRDRLAGRSDIGIVFGAVTVVDRDSRRALEHAKLSAALYIDVIGNKDPYAFSEFKKEILLVKRLMSEGKRMEAASVIPDRLARMFVFAGTPDEIIVQALEIYNAGAKRIEFGSPHGIDEANGINLLGQEVLPALKKHMATR